MINIVFYYFSKREKMLFISAIEKKKSLMVPLRPMTQKQQVRYEKRMQHITEKRINRIRKLDLFNILGVTSILLPPDRLSCLCISGP